MNIFEIAKRVGSGLIRELVPGGGLLIEAVNEILPDGQKLPTNATGDMLENAAKGLPPEQQAELMLKQFDVQINETTQANETVRTMLASEAISPQSTRPRIAYGCFWVAALSTNIIVCAWAYAVLTGDQLMIQAVTNGWPFVASITAPFVTLLWAYFGILKQEQKNKLDAANGLTHASTALEKIGQIFKKGKS